jgi:hypothetical protein
MPRYVSDSTDKERREYVIMHEEMAHIPVGKCLPLAEVHHYIIYVAVVDQMHESSLLYMSLCMKKWLTF